MTLKKPSVMMAKERRIIGVARVDFDDDLAGGVVETGDGSLCERERIVVNRKIANSDVARVGNLQCRYPGRIDQLPPFPWTSMPLSCLSTMGRLILCQSLPASREGRGGARGPFADTTDQLVRPQALQGGGSYGIPARRNRGSASASPCHNIGGRNKAWDR